MTNPTTIDEILLQFIAEYHQGLNELAGHGTAVEQAKVAIKQLLVTERIDELDNLGFSYGVISYQAIGNRITELKATTTTNKDK